MSSKSMKSLEWSEFKSLSPRDKGRYLRAPEGNLQVVVYSQQFDRALLDHLFSLADLVRSSKYNEHVRAYVRTLLNTKSCALYFTQPSTRTFTSFSLAAQTVGMITEEIRDPELSSLYKGESEIDTLLTLAELADAIVIRQGDHSFIERFAFEVMNRGYVTRVINGGSGSEQHPTQALLDLYTLVSHFELRSVEGGGFSVAIVGDLKRSRTAHSLSYLLALYPRIKQYFVAPDELQMGEGLIKYLNDNNIQHAQTDDFDALLPEMDAVYMMRMQDEYGTTSEDLRRKYAGYCLTTDRVETMKSKAGILHPLPRRAELPLEVDRDPRALYWEAVNRGKFVRIALLLHMFGRDNVEKIAARAY